MVYLFKKNKFKGDLYLLVDEGVYSAAEGMANFCKNAKIAKLVGKKTGGDGVTLGLINDVCPNSGLVFTYTNTLGYAPDGMINEEEKTALVVVPDYQLSLAIGKSGQNARLAAKLTNWKIDIKSVSQMKEEMEAQEALESTDFVEEDIELPVQDIELDSENIDLDQE